MTAIRIHGLTRRFDDVTAVDAMDLQIEHGELFFLLGPSGCGKTTLLRMIAGFIDPTAGSIAFDDVDVTNRPPDRRNVGMVFQSYALWPHMTVFDNVAFGLSARKIRGEARRRRVMEALELVQMQNVADRKPGQLSGGQQQRVALARAIVIEPAVLLLDEPLSNLDARLRLDMRWQIKRICEQTDVTTIYVTHDQKEALSMADRIAVMRHGRVVQIGDPPRLYQRPESRFVADFLGESNFIPARVTAVDGSEARLDTPAGPLASTAWTAPLPDPPGDVLCSIRPEALRSASTEASNTLAGTIRRSTYLGAFSQYQVDIAGDLAVKWIETSPTRVMDDDARVTLTVDPADVVILPADDGPARPAGESVTAEPDAVTV